jgi:hypothetical protein
MAPDDLCMGSQVIVKQIEPNFDSPTNSLPHCCNFNCMPYQDSYVDVNALQVKAQPSRQLPKG